MASRLSRELRTFMDKQQWRIAVERSLVEALDLVQVLRSLQLVLIEQGTWKDTVLLPSHAKGEG